MTRSSASRIAAAALAVVVVLAAACGGSGDAAPGAGTELPRLEGSLKGAGSTFQKIFNEEAIIEYRSVQPDLTVTYGEPKGSGAGRTALADQQVDFAGTDGVVKAEDKPKFKGGAILYVPTVAAPITVAYNVRQIDSLVVDAQVLARMFTGSIVRWNDPAIAALNPGTKLPSTKVVPVVRQDSSGTTENFTKYLAGAAPEAFRVKPASQPEWPAATSTRSPGNSGVASSVKSTPGAIGYVDLSDARAAGLPFASVKNRSGRAVQPTVDAAEAALVGATVKDDLTYDPLNAPGPDAYPITAPTWVIVYAKQSDPQKAAQLRSFLRFLVGPAQGIAKEIDYAPLPSGLLAKAQAQVEKIS